MKNKNRNKNDVRDCIKQTLIPHVDYEIITADPATGILYIINNFLSGHVRLRGRPNGSYPYNYLEMIEAIFGKADKTIEVCSGHVEGDDNTITVDIDSHLKEPDSISNAEYLADYPDNFFDRWRADPPYNERTARKMYNCRMPNFFKLLKAGARVVKPGSLLFLLCAQNYQICPPSLKRIGLITISVVPNNEIRALNIYQKQGGHTKY